VAKRRLRVLPPPNRAAHQARMLDPRTLLLTLIALLLITGLIQLVSARQARDEAGLPYWAAANLTAGLGVLVMGLMVQRPIPVLMNLAFATVLLAYMLNWAGMRRFCCRQASPAVIVAPPILWLALNQLPFFQSLGWRVALSALFAAAASLATAWTLYRFREEDLVARRPAIAWLAIHGTLVAARAPLVLTQSFTDGASALASPVITFSLFGGIIHTVLLSFLQLALTKGRADNRYRRAAATDMLTGIANRRAFFDLAEPLVQTAVRSDRPACVLVVDIDRFKAINDSLGHAGGDAVIIAVAKTIADNLRPGDVFGRLGGEEFGCFLPATDLQSATRLAEDLRARIAALDLSFDGTAVKVSASIGIAPTDAATSNLDRLLAEADAGLYQAKRAGRDRVVAMDVVFR
jgi:diguanylate cyclase (GGDEF)-like protein